MKFINFISIFLLLFVTSCGVGERKIVLENNFEISVPKSFENASDLNQSAILELVDKKENVFFIVIQDKKSELKESDLIYDINAYTKFAVRNATLNISELKLSETTLQNINDCKSSKTQAEGLIDGNKVFFEVFIIETKGSYYQLISWMPEDKKADNLSKVDDFVGSFKAL